MNSQTYHDAKTTKQETVRESKLVKKTVWQREKETYSVSFSPVFACEWIHAGHWSCFLLARLSSWIYVNWPCLRQPLKDISLLEGEGRRGCRPSWASSCMGGWGAGWECGRVLHPPDWAQSLRFKFQHYACLLIHVDLFQLLFPCRWGHVMSICVCASAALQLLCVCTAIRGNPMHPSATAAASALVNQHKGKCISKFSQVLDWMYMVTLL